MSRFPHKEESGLKTIELIRAEVEVTAEIVRVVGFEETSNEVVAVTFPTPAPMKPTPKKKEAKDG